MAPVFFRRQLVSFKCSECGNEASAFGEMDSPGEQKSLHTYFE